MPPWLSSWVISDQSKSRRETDGKVFHPCLHMQIAASFSTVINYVQNNQKLSLHNLPFQSKEFCKDLIFCNPSNFSEFRMKNVFIIIGRNLSKTAIVVFQESFFSFPSFVQFACQHRVLGAAYCYTRILLSFQTGESCFFNGFT